MTVSKRVGIVLMAGIIGLCALELGERLSMVLSQFSFEAI